MKGRLGLRCIVFPVVIFIFLTSFYPSDIEGGVFGTEEEQEAYKEASTNNVQEQARG